MERKWIVRETDTTYLVLRMPTSSQDRQTTRRNILMALSLAVPDA